MVSTEDPLPSELTPLIRKITARFWVIDSNTALHSLGLSISHVPAPFDHPAEAFRANVAALVTTVSLPYTLAHASARERHVQHVHVAERIRAAARIDRNDAEIDADYEKRKEEAASRATREKVREFFSSRVGRNAVVDNSMTFLDRALSNNDVDNASSVLLLQGVVLCWAAFEVFCREAFIALLNQRPKLVEQLLRDPTAKRRFEGAKISFETLAANDFDLSNRMGTMLAEQQDLSDINSIKATYCALFRDDTDVRDVLSGEDLRLLSQRRHVVVHQGGKIDSAYARSSGCTQSVGERLVVSPSELEGHLHSVIGAVCVLLSAVARAVDRSTLRSD